MSRTNALHAIEPGSEKLLRVVRTAVLGLLRVYWGIFQLWGWVFLYGIAFVLIGAGISDLAHNSRHWLASIFGITLGLGFLVSIRFRRIAWAAFGFGIIWFVVLIPPLISIFGPDYVASSKVAQAGLGVVYFLPPLIAALMSEFARKGGRGGR